MNKLLSFRPEPFDSEFEFEGSISGFGAQDESFEQEEEYEGRRPRRSARGSFRSGAAPRPGFRKPGRKPASRRR